MRRSVLCLLSLLFMVTILLSSCRKDDDGRRVRETVDLIAIIDHGETASKAYIDADDYACWSNGDRVRINNDAANPYTITLNASNRNQAIISGVTVTDDGHYAGIFPASFLEGDIDLSSGSAPSATVVLPFEQNYGDTTVGGETYQKVRAPMVGYTTDGRYLKFRNPCALLRVNISNSDATYPITLHQILVRTSGDAAAWLSGKGVINGFGSTAPEIAPTSEATYTVALNIEPSNITVAANNAETKSFYVVIPPLDFSDANFTIEVRAVKNDTYYDFSRTQSSATTSHCVIPRNSISNVNINFGDANYTAASGPFLGKGTEFDPYIIANKGDLLRLRNYVRDNTADTYMGGYFNSNTKYFRQIADIDISDETTWGRNTNYAIGTNSHFFVANYNGGGHWIKLGITSAQGSANLNTTQYPVGVFGVLGTGAAVKNLVSTGSINVDTAKVAAGGIVGSVNGSVTIYNCKNDATITSTQTGYYTHAAFGGICGRINATGCGIIIRNCTNKGPVNTSAYINKNGGGLAAGGICGAILNGTTVSIDNCINQGIVQSRYYTGSAYYYGQNVGGILGSVPFSRGISVTVSNCINECPTVSGNCYVGGIVGISENGTTTLTIRHCKNSARIYAWNASDGNIYSGGIVGYCNYHLIDNCYHCGDLVGRGRTIGGIIGYAKNDGANSGYVRNCMVDTRDRMFSGYRFMGGIIANARAVTASSERIENCCFYGTITSSDRYYLSGIVSIGGAYPPLNTYYVNNCLVSATIPSSYSGNIYRLYSGSNSQNTNFCYVNDGHGAVLNQAKALYNSMTGAWSGNPVGTAGVNYYDQNTYPTVGDALRHWVYVNNMGGTYSSWTDDDIPVLDLSFSDITGYVEL